MIAELVAARKSLGWSSEYSGGLSPTEKEFWKAWGIDRTNLVKEALAERKQARAEKKKAKGKPSLTEAAEETAQKKDGKPFEPRTADVKRGEKEAARRKRLHPEEASGNGFAGEGNGKPSLAQAVKGKELPEDLKVGARVRDKDLDGEIRTGRIVALGKKGDQITSATVEWDLQRGEKKKKTSNIGPLRPGTLTVIPEEESGPTAAEIIQEEADRTEDPVVKKRLNRVVKDLASEPRGQCKVCGCTEMNCQNCVERMGHPCSWTDNTETLCTACLDIVNAELTTLPGLEASTIKLINQSKTYRHVSDVWGKTTDQLVDFATGIGARRNLLEAVNAWVKDQLSKTEEGDSIVAPGEMEAITRETILIDLVTLGPETPQDARALEKAGLNTVGDLLDRAAKADRLVREEKAYRGDSQLIYATLREVKDLSVWAVNEIGDALVDAGLTSQLAELRICDCGLTTDVQEGKCAECRKDAEARAKIAGSARKRKKEAAGVEAQIAAAMEVGE